MPIKYNNAVDELYGMVFATASALDTVPEIRWPGAPSGTPAPMDALWIRPSFAIVTDTQAALANVNGVKRYRAIGLLFIQVFAPRNTANALNDARTMAETFRDAFKKQSTTGAIWFRNQKVVEVPSDENWYQINVSVTCEYDTIN